MRRLSILFCVAVLLGAAWVGGRGLGERKAAGWTRVAPDVLRSPGWPAGYALVAGEKALLIDAPRGPEELREHGVKTIDAVLLTHHHRDSCASINRYRADKVPVRAPKASAEWLLPDAVQKHWAGMFPLRGSRANYFVFAEGIDGIDCSLTDGQVIEWQGWKIRVVETPGHSRDHVAYLARKGDGPALLFAGDALASPGKLWTPFTTDWDHWTDAGLKPAYQSLRKLAALKPAVVLPAHGEPIERDAARVLEQTAAAVEENGFLRSFERFSKERLKNAPTYAFLTPEQARSNGSLPWSRVSEHLWLTGNTYVLVSKHERAYLVIDPWDPNSAKQLPKLKADQKLGKLEVIWCSHAHFDHFDGIYSLPERSTFQVWTLDRVAEPLLDPSRLWAPFLDARPLTFDKLPKDGDTLTWREYRFRFRFLPGQTEFTMGVETEIDGKKCFFTADNFFHQDQFSGSGGWMGLNRSSPLPYAASAQKVLDAAPEWVLAEHGGPFEFSAEDFRRRVQWGKVSATAADAISPSGDHRQDWNPHLIRIEPVLQKAKPGDVVKATLIADNLRDKARRLTVASDAVSWLADPVKLELEVPAKGAARHEIQIKVGPKVTPGRHVVTFRITDGNQPEPAETFLAVDVQP